MSFISEMSRSVDSDGIFCSVAVIIPCYRDSNTLARALDSVRAQTCRVDEVIVVNDDSPETAAIEQVLMNYPEVIYKKNPCNMGLAATRNVGVDLSTSKIVSFLDADDQLHPQKIEFQLAVCSGEVAVTCGVRRVSTACQFSMDGRFGRRDRKTRSIKNSRFVFRNSLTGAAMMIRRDIFLRLGGYDSSLRSCEDFDLWLRLISSGIEVISIDCPLYVYHYNPDGLSNNFRNISRWEIVVLNKHLKGGFWTSITFCVWLGKHIVRAKLTRDNILLDTTFANATYFVRPPWFAGLFIWFGKRLPLALVSLVSSGRNGA